MPTSLPMYSTMVDWAKWSGISRVMLHRLQKDDPKFPPRRVLGKFSSEEMRVYLAALAKDGARP